LKVLEAAARGVPIVCSTLVARQLGWSDGIEVLTADTAADFAAAVAALYADRDLWLRLRETALTRVSADYSAIAFRSAVSTALTVAAQALPVPT
jgi:glycosyltransferase involved in cell wall biosynthesis